MRGYEFLPIQIGKSRGVKYVLEDGKVRLPFAALKGLGASAALALENVTIHGEDYLSVEELQQASGVTSAVIDRLRQIGAWAACPRAARCPSSKKLTNAKTARLPASAGGRAAAL